MNPLDDGLLDGQGYVLLTHVLDIDTVASLRRAFADAPAQRDGTQHVDIDDTTPECDVWRALTSHEAMRSACRHFEVDGTVFVHGRNPLPGYGQQGLHADSRPRSPGEPTLGVTALWMLDDFTATNGATRVVPGSHHLLHSVPKSWAQPAARHPDEVIVEAPAGSVLVFNAHLWHSGRRNDSEGQRRVAQMTCHVGGMYA